MSSATAAAKHAATRAGSRSRLTALIVGYHYPPIGGVGAQRAVHLTRYLGEFGIRPLVFTGPGLHGDRWGLDDSTMLTDVTGVEVVRADGPIPLSENRLEARINRMIGRRGVFVRWWIDSVKRFERAPGQEIDVILGELGPYETSFGVEKLAARLGVPWVADLQDPWALDEMRLYPTALHRLADRRRMRSTLRSAAAVVMNTPEAAARLLSAFPELRRQRVVSITNGFDAKDFGQSVPEREDSAFRIVHSGSLHTDLAQQERTAGRIRRRLGGMPVLRRFSYPLARLPHGSRR